MRRPKDPRHNGLKEPKKVYSKTEQIVLSDLDKHYTHKVSLQTLIGAWNKVLKELESQGHCIVEGPYFQDCTYYDSKIKLTYRYEWPNLSYNAEMANFVSEVNAYEEQMILFRESEEKKKNGPPPNVDEQIVRAERRLANLKAVKAGEPIPYPEG
jgi:hypothetical protein